MPVAAHDARSLRWRRPYPWAELMRRELALDELEGPRCHEPMTILAVIHTPDTAGAIPECLGFPARPPPVAPARRRLSVPRPSQPMLR
jgi:hypothetical protein